MFFDTLISKRHRLGARRRFLLGLRRVEVPVLDAIELDLVEQMVLGRQLVDVSGRRRVGDVEARLREGVRRPDVGERAAAAARHPDARVLRAPASGRERRAGRGRRCRAPTCTAGGRYAAAEAVESARRRASESSPAIHSRPVARGLMPPVKMPEAAHDVGAALRRLEQRPSARRRPGSRASSPADRAASVPGCSAISTVSGFSVIVSRTM